MSSVSADEVNIKIRCNLLVLMGLILEVNTVVILVVSLSLMSSTTILQILNEETDINHCYMSPASSSLI